MITIVDAHPVLTPAEMAEYIAGVLAGYRREVEADLDEVQEPPATIYGVLADVAARLGLDEYQTANVLGPIGSLCLETGVTITPLGQAALNAGLALAEIVALNSSPYVAYDELDEQQKDQVAAMFAPLPFLGDYDEYGYELGADGDVLCRKRLAEIKGVALQPVGSHQTDPFAAQDQPNACTQQAGPPSGTIQGARR